MKIATLIGSCDDYSFLWKNFDTLFKRYCLFDTEKYLVSENIDTFLQDYNVIHPGNLQWGSRILNCLDNIKEEYVLFVLDDYYFNMTIDQNFINEQITAMKKYSADKILFHPGNDLWWAKLTRLENDLCKFTRDSQYLNSVQPAIWRVDYLKKVMSPDYSPWQFELDGNYFTSSLNPTILLRELQSSMYFNIVRKGKVFSKGYDEFLNSEGLSF